MGLIEVASTNSVWRGIDYYDNKKVVSWDCSEAGVYDGKVSGSKNNVYTVHIDTLHPRKNDRSFFRRHYLNPMLKKGQIKMTIPEKPKSGNQKYYT